MDEQLLRQIVDKFHINPSVLTDGTEGLAWATGEAKKTIISTNRKINMKATEEQNKENRTKVELLEFLMKALKVQYKGGKANIKKFEEASKSIDRYRQAVQESEPEPKPELVIPQATAIDDPKNLRQLPDGRYVTQPYISLRYPRGFIITSGIKRRLTKLSPEEYSQLRTVPFPRGEKKRCPRGFRINRQTGECENTRFREGKTDEELIDADVDDMMKEKPFDPNDPVWAESGITFEGEVTLTDSDDEEPFQQFYKKVQDSAGIWSIIKNPDFRAGDGEYGGVGDEFVDYERPHIPYEDLIPSEQLRWTADWAEWEADEDAQGEFDENFDDWRESDYRKDKQLFKSLEQMTLQPIVSSTPTITAEPETTGEPERVYGSEWSWGGFTYIKDDDSNLYDIKTSEHVGWFDEEEQEIIEVESEEDTTDEEEEDDMMRQLINEYQATGMFAEDEEPVPEVTLREVMTGVKPVSPPPSPEFVKGKRRRKVAAVSDSDDSDYDAERVELEREMRKIQTSSGVRRGGGKQKGAGRRPQQADWRETGTESGFEAFQQHQNRERLKKQMREQGTLASSVLTPPPSTPTPTQTAEEAEFAERMREGFATAPRRADLIVPPSFGTQVTDVPSGF